MIHRDVNPAEDANVHADGNADADLRMAECNLAFLFSFLFWFSCKDVFGINDKGNTTSTFPYIVPICLPPKLNYIKGQVKNSSSSNIWIL